MNLLTPYGSVEIVSSPYVPLEQDVIGPGVAPEPYRRERVLGYLIRGRAHVNPQTLEELFRSRVVKMVQERSP